MYTSTMYAENQQFSVHDNVAFTLTLYSNDTSTMYTENRQFSVHYNVAFTDIIQQCTPPQCTLKFDNVQLVR